VRTVSRSEAAREAAKVDACRQEYESGQSEQSEPHGGSVQRVDGHRVCVHCGCSHGISQEGTLAGHRRDGPNVAADGGVEVLDAKARQEELRERWADAEAAVVVGESPQRRRRREKVKRELRRDPEATALEVVARLGLPPDCRQLVEEVRAGVSREEVVGFDDRVPTWRVKSVTVEGEERPASPGNGVDMVEVQGPRQTLEAGLDLDHAEKYRCACGVAAYGTDMVAHLRTHGLEEPERLEVEADGSIRSV
jgi:hypothetical protein